MSAEEILLLVDEDEAIDLTDALGALAGSEKAPNATMMAIAEQFPEPAGWTATATVPFSSARKWSGGTFGAFGSWVVGAPEMLMPNDRRITNAMGDATTRGKRVLLVARSARPLTRDQAPLDLEPVALVVIADRIRADAAGTLRFFADQGVEAKVISGDHPDTVAAIAREVGIEGEVVDARHLPEDESALVEVLERGTIFGRVTPHQKRAMVKALQSQGHVVAMTGDGVNDVLALKDADIGIAMGSGSGASRAVAQLVLLDASFATIPSVVAEGRRVIGNIERVANLFVTKTVYAFLFAVFVGIFARVFPFVPRHLTLIGTLTIGAPAFVLALAPTTDRARPGFVGRVLKFAVPVGAIAAVATFSAYELAISEGVDLLRARTLATIVLVAIGMFALIMNSRPLTPGKRALIGSMGALFGLILITRGMREFFELETPRLLVLLAGIGIIGITGALLYASLRSVGWLQQMPQLLRTPFEGGRAVGALRTGIARMRDRARRIGEARGAPQEPPASDSDLEP
jgi:cation-transporting ATPase E